MEKVADFISNVYGRSVIFKTMTPDHVFIDHHSQFIVL